MFDPSPPVGLPEVEFVEIFNITNESILMSGWTLNDRPIPEIILMPGEWRVLCEISKIDQFSHSIQSIGMESWDRLNNEGQSIVLRDNTGNTMDTLAYGPEWISDPLKKYGGWSLELINPNKNCSDRDNWSVSVNINGGTPGFNNSVFNTAPDLSAPHLLQTEWLDPLSLQLTFNESVNYVISEKVEDVFIITPGPVPLDFTYKNYSRTHIITLYDALDTGRLYMLRIKNIFDCELNYLNDTLIPIGIGKEPLFNEVLITELMVDEIPTVGLPESEYIEILNNSNQLLQLNNSCIFTDSRVYRFPDLLLHPASYYVLVPKIKSGLYTDYTNTIVLEKFPSLNNDGKMLGIYNLNTGLIFSLIYNKSWYKDLSKSDGGYSLEMIDIKNPCGDANNWAASMDGMGGTPGKINSFNIDNPDLTGPEIKNAHVLEEGTLYIEFNEKLHPECFGTLSIFIENQFLKNQWDYDTILLNKIEVDVSSLLMERDRYQLKINGAKDCVGNYIREENSSVFINVPVIARSDEIVINEILFNPRPGGVDWIEIYNQSEKYVDLINYYMSNEASDTMGHTYPVSDKHILLEPYSFLVLTADKRKLMTSFPGANPENVLELHGLPGMPDSEGYISLWTSEKIKIDEVAYDQGQHNLLLKNREGVSLERVSPQRSSSDRDNWQSASSHSGYGTPTYRNSQYLESDASNFNVTVYPPIFSPDHDGWDDYLNININSSRPGFLANIFIFDVQGKMVKALSKGSLLGTGEHILWDGVLDNGQLSTPGHYILLFEMFHPDGDAFRHKEKIVIGRKL
jgi:hypothetical protein